MHVCMYVCNKIYINLLKLFFREKYILDGAKYFFSEKKKERLYIKYVGKKIFRYENIILRINEIAKNIVKKFWRIYILSLAILSSALVNIQ